MTAPTNTEFSSGTTITSNWLNGVNDYIQDRSYASVIALGTGIQTVFPVSFTPHLIHINGVWQNQNSYTVAGGNVTFSEAPPITSTIEFVF